MSARAPRIRSIDWLRGLAVVFMIQCHALVLLLPELRRSEWGNRLVWLDGMVAPAFLLAAGFALAYTQVHAARAGRNPGPRRIWEVLAVATLVNGMWFPLFQEPKWLLRVDILHCIGLSLLLLYGVVRALRHRPLGLMAASALLATGVFFLSPFAEQVEGGWALLANKSRGAVFPLLPWSGYVFLGSALGAATGQAGVRGLWYGLWGVMGVSGLIWLFTPRFRELYPPHDFNLFNPAEHLRRVCVVSGFTLCLLALEQRWPQMARGRTIQALEVLGTSSLSAYFFHQALLFFPVLGFSFARYWKKSAGWGEYTALTLLLVALTLALSWWTGRVYQRVRATQGWLERWRWGGKPSPSVAHPDPG